MTKLSIIIPIYNTGIYLHKCIKSILSQKLLDFELILVDDGSKDDSGAICDEYAEKDSRIKVIHKENEGVSIARNTGISMAEGEYIGFVDSDDWIEADMYETMYKLALSRECDIVMCDAVTKYDDLPDEEDTITGLSGGELLSKKDIHPELLREMAGSSWRCIYKKELLKNNNITFPQNIPLSEDRMFNILAFGYANGVYYTKTPFYNRYVREGSAVSKYYGNYLEIMEKVRRGTFDVLDKAWGGEDSYKKCYEIQTLQMAFNAICMPFYKTSPLGIGQKYKEVKKVCENNVAREAITALESQDLRSKLILKKRVFMLCVLGIILNKKHGR